MNDPDAQRLAPPPVPADVGIIMALPIEAGYLLDRLKAVRRYTARSQKVVEGEIAGKIVAVALSGVGKTAARRATELLIAGHHPRWLCSAGFAGALDPTLKRNDLIMPHEVCDLAGGRVEVNSSALQIPGIARTSGRLLTVDRVIARASEKAELRSLHQADLIDMESFELARLARERTIPILSVRVVSDDASTELPAEVARLLTHTGSYRAGVALRAVWNRPAALKDFWTLHTRAMEAADRLASCLGGLIARLDAP
jgi:adenosylhomocysteine nucleosidase